MNTTLLSVLFFKNGLDHIDGSGEHLANYAVSLGKLGHRVSVLIANPTSNRNQYLGRMRGRGIDVRCLGDTTAVVRRRYQRALLKLIRLGRVCDGLPSWSDVLEAGLAEILQATRPDLVHVFVDPAAPLGLRAAIRARIPTLCHELISPRSSPATDCYYDELAEILPHCAGVAAQSALLARECQGRIPFRGRVAVLPNIVEDPGDRGSGLASREAGEVVYGFASRLEPRKAPLVLLDAFCEALKCEPRLRLRIAGDGPMRPRLLERATQLRILDRCDFLGRYSGPSERDAFFDSVDVVVQPSLAEGLPNTVIEGMARAKAIISTTVGGIPDVLSETSAVLIPPGDMEALASALTVLAREPELRRSLGRAARSVYLRMFSPGAVLPLLLGEYQEVLAEARCRGGSR
jgi:glycosyltransferase involved in cell wall biosynthesis